ncbi:MAG: hypothetical protein VX152_12460 [Pseudomonadota bacterium]|nr:hypothetical protein [Pseudomonadota bacterium]
MDNTMRRLLDVEERNRELEAERVHFMERNAELEAINKRLEKQLARS